MPFHQPVIHIMTAKPVALDVNQKLSDARSVFSGGQINHLPVVEEGKLVGIISSNDLIKLSLLYDDDGSLDEFLDNQYPVATIMHPHPVSVGADATVREAAQILAASSFHALPVLGHDGSLIGIVTSTDLIELLLEKLPQAAVA